MLFHKVVVITTTHLPTRAVQQIAGQCSEWTLLVVGDRKTPPGWNWPGTRFLPVSEQLDIGGTFAAKCPLNHYARKNIGYLWAIAHGAGMIAETDDDNIPYPNFLENTYRQVSGRQVRKAGWENVYTHFSSQKIWPRGFPLERIADSLREPSPLGDVALYDCPIQQYLADGDPDVDAVYRLTTVAETRFQPNTVILSKGTFCPFNSQNTLFWPDAYPLLYLPAHVSFRMTDIWRSFIAQICLHARDLHIAFREPTVFQDRNQHSLLRDFADEIPGYLNNARILDILSALPLSPDPGRTGENLWRCYDALVRADIVPAREMEMVDLWLQALDSMAGAVPASG
ncbi:MAG: DUF288 domain-containing protein [Bryobacterales bacterium]|nr:DUF288 domain-containing protein [Bryobacterales bacterium]